MQFPEPTAPRASRSVVLVEYLDYFRSRIVAKVSELTAAEARTSRLPSGWTPLELAVHLRHVERRWLEWGFEGHDVGEPWADRRDGRWYVAPDRDVADVLAELSAQGRRTAEIVAPHALGDVGAPGERWDGELPPTLERVLLHLVQEYARHLGHLDIVAELAGARVGE